MRDITLERPEQYQDEARYRLVEGGIYQETAEAGRLPEGMRDDSYRMALSFTTEEGEGQYPLEDVLDRFLVHVEDVFVEAPEPATAGARVVYGFGGDVADLQGLATIIGKHVYNERFEEDGHGYVRLVVE